MSSWTCLGMISVRDMRFCCWHNLHGSAGGIKPCWTNLGRILSHSLYSLSVERMSRDQEGPSTMRLHYKMLCESPPRMHTEKRPSWSMLFGFVMYSLKPLHKVLLEAPSPFYVLGGILKFRRETHSSGGVIYILYSIPPSYPQFHFLWFQLPAVHHGLEMLNGKFQK